MASKKIPSAVLGLDIGSTAIKAVEVKYLKGKPVVTGIVSADLPEGTFDSELIVNPEELGKTVKELLASNNIKTKNVVCALSGQTKVIVRVVEVPKMTKKELDDTMKFQVESNVPFPANEIVKDYEVIENPEADVNDPNFDVLFAAAQQDLVNSYMAMLKFAGLKVAALDVNSLAVGRAVLESEKNEEGKTGIIGVVDLGASFSSFGVFENGDLKYPNPPLSVGGNSLTAEVAQILGVEKDEAEESKKQYGYADAEIFNMLLGIAQEAENEEEDFDFNDAFSTFEEQAQAVAESHADDEFGDLPGLGGGLGDILGGSVDTEDAEEAAPAPAVDNPLGLDAGETEAEPLFDLGDKPFGNDNDTPFATDDIDPNSLQGKVLTAIATPLIDLANEIRRSLEYYNTRYNKDIDKLVLCGGGANLGKIADFLAGELGVETEVVKPMAGFAVEIPDLTEQYINEISPSLTAALGLAVRDMVE